MAFLGGLQNRHAQKRGEYDIDDILCDSVDGVVHFSACDLNSEENADIALAVSCISGLSSRGTRAERTVYAWRENEISQASEMLCRRRPRGIPSPDRQVYTYPPQPPAATLSINGAISTLRFLNPKAVKPHTMGRRLKARRQIPTRSYGVETAQRKRGKPRYREVLGTQATLPVTFLNGVSLLLYRSRSVPDYYFLCNVLTYNAERIILLIDDYRRDVPLGKALLHSPPLWLIVVATISLALPSVRLKKVAMRPERLSNYALSLLYPLSQHPRKPSTYRSYARSETLRIFFLYVLRPSSSPRFEG